LEYQQHAVQTELEEIKPVVESSDIQLVGIVEIEK
jgi:hypothetical protein